MPRIKSKLTTTEKDMGYKAARKAIAEAKKHPEVEIGILSRDGGKKNQGDSFNLAQIAAVQEFGTADGTVPQRSFIRSTMEEKRKQLNLITDIQIAQILAGRTTIKKSLNLLGVQISSFIKRKITILRDPPNAPSTIAQKGSSNPLIDTGRLRSSINHKVKSS